MGTLPVSARLCVRFVTNTGYLHRHRQQLHLDAGLLHLVHDSLMAWALRHTCTDVSAHAMLIWLMGQVAQASVICTVTGPLPSQPDCTQDSHRSSHVTLTIPQHASLA
jgi:hypothetical protein